MFEFLNLIDFDAFLCVVLPGFPFRPFYPLIPIA